MYIVGAQEAQITKIAKTVILIQGYEREPLQALCTVHEETDLQVPLTPLEQP